MKRMTSALALFLPLLMALVVLTVGCTTGQPKDDTASSKLTVGEVKMTIVKGQTTQAEVLEHFGSPNLVTRNSDNEEVWGYNKMSYETKAGSDYGTLIFFGGSKAVTSATTKSFDLIVTFDAKDVVRDYKVISAAY